MIFSKIIKSLFPKKNIHRPSHSHQIEGTIKYFNAKRGFGFIQSAEASKDVFVHVTEANGKVYKGDRVLFRLEENEKGLVARNVERLK
jgi:CspA family cold shock protein